MTGVSVVLTLGKSSLLLEALAILVEGMKADRMTPDFQFFSLEGDGRFEVAQFDDLPDFIMIDDGVRSHARLQNIC